MHEMERMQHQLHARLPAFKRKVDQAKRIIDETVNLGVNFACAFSGGSDSTVLFDLLSRQGYQGDTLFGDDGYDFPQTIDFLAQTKACYGLPLQRIRCMQP